MLKSREHAKNRELGIGDENGKIPARVKPANVMGKCTKCMVEIRMTSTNTEAREHFTSRHPTSTFAECFPGHFDPTAVAAAPVEAQSDAVQAPVIQPVKKAAPKQDLSFLNEALAFNPNKVVKKK